MEKKLTPIHPGEVLFCKFMEPLGLSANALALALRVPANRITAIVNGTRGVTGDTALRLSRRFGTTAEFWMNLQASYDLALAVDLKGEQIAHDVIPAAYFSSSGSAHNP